jgi:hypothetical protein
MQTVSKHLSGHSICSQRFRNPGKKIFLQISVHSNRLAQNTFIFNSRKLILHGNPDFMIILSEMIENTNAFENISLTIPKIGRKINSRI